MFSVALGMDAGDGLSGPPQARAGAPTSDQSSTIQRNISVKYPQAINTFAVDITGGFAALAGYYLYFYIN